MHSRAKAEIYGAGHGCSEERRGNRYQFFRQQQHWSLAAENARRRKRMPRRGMGRRSSSNKGAKMRSSDEF